MGKTTLGERLLEVMQELGIESPKELSRFCDVSEGLVSQWFSGTTKLGAKPLIALARTQFSLDWIVDGRLPKYSAHRKRSVLEVVPATDQRISADQLIELLALFDAAGERERVIAIKALRPSAEKNGLRWGRVGNDKP
jgi:transcriptional regulator with XRE-family HTH domain